VPSAAPSRPLQLVTDRLLLRRYQRADIPDLVNLIGAREIAEMTLRVPHPYTIKDAQSLLQQVAKDPNLARFAIVVRDTNRLCGGIGLNLELPHDRAELGYWVGVPFWGNGYCTEAARALLHHGFERLGLRRIYASCFINNPASRRVLEKLGFQYEGCLRQHINKWNEYRDLEYFGLLATEWRASRA
jgi:ribosomal-protein-alanine N-acetyltransferase